MEFPVNDSYSHLNKYLEVSMLDLLLKINKTEIKLLFDERSRVEFSFILKLLFYFFEHERYSVLFNTQPV